MNVPAWEQELIAREQWEQDISMLLNAAEVLGRRSGKPPRERAFILRVLIRTLERLADRLLAKGPP